MAKKITLTVNESLFSKIDQWRSSFNLSKVFQDAVSEAIKAKEEFHRMLSGKEDIPQIIERLKTEKRNYLEKARHDGQSDGGAWASQAHYKDLVCVLASMDEMPASTRSTGIPLTAEDQSVEDWQQKENSAGTNSPVLAESIQAYRDGWRIGVRGLWEMVKDKLDD